MREKFSKPRETNYLEQAFIDRMEHTHDTYGISEKSLSMILGVNGRKLRKYKERYNNRLYSNITPQGKIICIAGLYKLIRPESVFKNRLVLKARYDLVCQAIDYHNTLKSLGDNELEGQINLYDIGKLIDEANQLKEKIDREE